MTGDRPIRVLWLIRGLGPGGAERLLVAHARAAGPGFAYEVAYQNPAKDQLVPELEDAGVTVHRLGSGPTWPLELHRLVRDRRIDIIHAHSPAMAAPARVVAHVLRGRRRTRLVYTEHNRWSAYRLPTRTANAVTYRLDDRDLAVSEEARSSVSSWLRPRVETLHHGIDGDGVRAAAGDRAAVRASLGLDDATFAVAQVANFRIEKAHQVMVEAGALLAGRTPAVRILMVGQGPRLEEIRALVAERGLEGTIDVLGFRPDVAAIVAAADALALSSDHEGLPVAVMEALALGTPIVSTDVGGMPEAVTDGVEGLLVPPGDPAALAGALRRLAADPALHAALAAGAARRSSQFEAAAAAERIEQVYRSCLGLDGSTPTRPARDR